MAAKGAHLGSELVNTVCERVRARLPERKAQLCEAFVRQYYHWVPAEDLADRGPLDLYGAALAHWNLAQQRTPGHAKVHVYNPDFEQHAWQSPHTVVEIVSDEMPFVVESVTMELGRQGYGIDLMIHPVIVVRRDADGQVIEVVERGATAPGSIAEAVLHAEVTREHDRALIAQLGESIERVLGEVRAAVEDWHAMSARTRTLIEELDDQPPPVDRTEVEEVKAFLAWVADNNFTFLGHREYRLVADGGTITLRPVPDSGLGILRGVPATPYTRLNPKALALAQAPHLLVLTKTNSRATVHRPAYLDYIGVKKFGSDGKVIAERRFLGLYSTATYKLSPRQIPLLRWKVKGVLERAGFPRESHDAKALLEILESYPHDSLFQIETDELFDVAMGILGLGERQRVRLFVRRDPLDRFVECLVTIPRDRYNTENRERVGMILVEAFGGTHLDWSLQLSESVLVRVRYIVHCANGVPIAFETADLEARLAQATRAWSDDLRDALIDRHGEAQGVKLHKRYEHAFPPAYRSDWVAGSAVADIRQIERLHSAGGPIMSLHRPLEAQEGLVRCKLFSSGVVSLSDVLPTFEHMGVEVVDERPYEIRATHIAPVWIHDFGLRGVTEDAERGPDIFQEAFLDVRRGELEDDGLNALALKAALTGRQITIVRAVARYLHQAAIAYSDAYIERTMTTHPDVAILLVRLFYARFDPDCADPDDAELLAKEIETAIDAVQSLGEDRILRSFLSIVRAIVRTNYFRVDGAGAPRPYLSFKLDASLVPILPLPRPRFEIFVYSPRLEGVHLRGGSVARGGLRWSDRPEDFRTEILGLMKAQMVKNSLIVPVGSKGGFVLKRPPTNGGREALQDEGIACYRLFLSGLLDLTDNVVAGEVVPPERVVRYDTDDPYLVVAADKGTAAFSDIANEVSAEFGFWLGDAFASGGSRGYDHKKMGITARGAWESVKRHFRELGTDIQESDFTLVGIGDMSGDVFGNGMLLSRHIRLLGAFNHMHVFLDPNPDPAASFAERQRLFQLPRSTWSDYDESCISEGGGVFARSAKSIPISPQVQEALGIEAERLAPTDLIRELLCAPVDLLWNGGIGTYVKASAETNAAAGDKGNDAVRVDGRQLRCRVVGEGGNLGFTQRGRIEYALAGGRINTDAIDNAAGVNCSDLEVNIKILLDSLIAKGDMTEKQRNELLVEMTSAVAERVVYASYTQTESLSLALVQAESMVDVYSRLVRHLEQVAGLHRELEFLPADDVISERIAAHQGLVAPELAVVMAYCKTHLYAQLLDSDLPEDEYLAHDLEHYFPVPLSERYATQMRSHRLRREIIATVVANELVDRAGTTFAFRLAEETGAPASVLAGAYAVAQAVFNMRSFHEEVERLDNKIEASTQIAMLIEGRQLAERATRWLAQANPHALDIALTIRYFAPGAQMLASAFPEVLEGADRETFETRTAELVTGGVPSALAARVAGMASLPSVFDIVEIAIATGRKQSAVMAAYFRLGCRLQLDWLRDRITDLPSANRWQSLARGALRDDLYSLHRVLTQEVLETGGATVDSEVALEAWLHRNRAAAERCLNMFADIKASRISDSTTLAVALREVRNLIRGGAPAERLTAPP